MQLLPQAAKLDLCDHVHVMATAIKPNNLTITFSTVRCAIRPRSQGSVCLLMMTAGIV